MHGQKLPDIAGLRYASGGLCLDSTECSPQLYEREGGSGVCAGVISGAWARGYPQISGAYDPGYSSGDILGHMPRISADIPGAYSKSSNL